MNKYKLFLLTGLLLGIYLFFCHTAFGQCFTTYTLSPSGTICGSSASLTLSGSQSGVSYQLQVAGANYGSPVAGTGSSISLGTVSSTISGEGFVVVASQYGSSCSPTVIAGDELNFTPIPVGSVAASSNQICSGNAVTFTVNSTVAGTYHYQWFENGQPISGQTLSTYTATTVGTYTVLFITNCNTTMLSCPAITAGTVTTSPGQITGPLTVSPASVTQTGIVVQSTYTVPGSSNASSYTWSLSPTTAGTMTGNGTTATVIWNPSFLGTATINVSANGTCGSTAATGFPVTAAPVLVPGNVSPSEQFVNSNVIPGQLISVLPTGGIGSYSYQWQSSPDFGITWAPASGNITTQNYTPAGQTATIYYRLMVNSGGLIAYSNSAVVVVGDCVSLNTNIGHAQNYILTSTPKTAGIINNAGLANQSTCDLMQSIQYLDGLGRLIQTIQIKGSPQLNDVVQPVAYDALGRDAIKYLPYSSTINDGSYKTDALTANAGQATFYASPPSVSGVSSVANPYAVTGFELSPLSRVIEQGAPGATWQLPGAANSSSTGHTERTLYTTNDQTSTFSSTYTPGTINTGSKIVALYTMVNNTLVRANNNATYAPGQLYVTVHRDENWNPATDGCIGTTEEYKDIDGHIVLKRSYNLKVVGSTSTVEMLSTYYVYDIYGNLALVLPPGASPDANAVIPQTTINSLCYQYGYDSRNRLIEKKLPGKGWEYSVYNSIDQPVATQDANQAAQNEWVVIKYDAQGREIMTALWNNGNTAILQPALQTIVNGHATLWETPVTTGNGYTNNAWPTSSITTTLTLNYYDNYSNISGFPGNFTAPTGATTATTGLPTASQTNILGTANMLWSAQYYDNLGRVITAYKQHYFGGVVSTNNYDQVTTTYNFNNQATTTTRKHFNTSSPGLVAFTISNRYIYDLAGRKIKTWQQIQNGTNTADSRTLVVQDVYNEIGQLLTKQLFNNTDSTNFYQNVNYAYNERGWLLNSSAPLFQEQMEYNLNTLNVAGFNAQYNGNISGQTRTITTSPTTVSYTYNYDRLNRLISGISTDGNSEQGIVYDQMGNITALQRSGANTDNLAYAYLNGNISNQLNTIANTSGSDSLMPNGTITYNNYDPNGNTLTDGRNATGITYNLLNLPQSITAKNVTYTYDATGRKLRRVIGTTSPVATEYLDGIEYDGGTLTFIQTEEGQAIPNTVTTYNYEYNLADHLGNERVMFDTKTGVAKQEQQDDYYPFGLNINRVKNGTVNKYLYNKKELQDVTNDYDYGTRFYDPVICRFIMVDPLATKYPWYTPYQFAGNEVPNAIDRDGMEPAYPQPDGSYTIARDGDLQKPLTDAAGISYLNSKTEVGGADKVFDSMTENLNNTGSALIVTGYLLAIPTDGASLSLVGVGEGFNSAGAAVSIVHDATNGKLGNIAATATLEVGFGKLGDIVKDSKAIESKVAKTVLRATISAGSMVADKIHEKMSADHEQTKEVKPEPQKANTQQNRDSEKNAQAFFKNNKH